MKKKLSGVLILCIAVIALCFLANTNLAHAKKEVNLGIITALTGPAAPWGIGNSRGMQLGAEAINEAGGFKVKGETYKWKVIVYDSKYVPSEAVKALNQAIYSDKISFAAIMGGSPLLGCIPLLKQNNILSLNNAAGGKAVTNPDNPLVFRFNPAIEISYAGQLPYLKKQHGVKTIISINPDDETGRSSAQAVKYVAGKLGGLTIIDSVFFERGSKDFLPILTKIIAKKPDMIETGMTDPTSQALILKQARELGYKGIMHLIWGPDPNHILKIAGSFAEGAYLGTTLPEPVNAKQKEIKAQFLKKYPEKEWDAMIYSEYCLAEVLTKAIVKCQSFDSAAVAKALEEVTWVDAYGPCAFGGTKLFGIKRQMLQQMNLLRVVKGKPVWVQTAGAPPGILD